jgi:hypothetical protein
MSKPTRGVKRLLDRMGDEYLYLTRDEKRDLMVYILLDDGVQRSDVVQRAIADGFIVPNNDALFDSQQSQTWRKA